MTIKNLFPPNKEVLICLFPFQRQVFADHFNWEANLKLTYPLLSKISWNEISNDIKFHSLSRLAKGILELHDQYKLELKEYCEWKKIELPDYAADKIPAVILIPLIQYLQKNGLREIQTKKINRFPDSETRLISFESKNDFEIYHEIKNAKALSTKNGVEILLPDYDCPYAILSGPKEICIDIVNTCDIEFLNTTSQTQFDWWNQ
jgi:hypothetical protein